MTSKVLIRVPESIHCLKVTIEEPARAKGKEEWVSVGPATFVSRGETFETVIEAGKRRVAVTEQPT